MGPSANHRRGFTLVEAVTSMVIAVVLLGGLGSAVLLATRALPRSDRPADAQLQEGPVLNRMITELQTACVISERTSRAIAFTVPDRDGDGRPERIRYAWSGTAGEPLTRTYNGGATTSLVADVRAFTLSYDVGSASEQYAGLPVQSGETLLRSYDSLLGLSEAHVHNDQWWAQYFKPSLPADALRWRVTRVRFVAKRDSGRDSTTAIQLLAPDDDTGLPSTTAVDSTTMAQLALPDAFTWIEKAFTKADNLAAGSGLYLAFTTTDSDSCRLRYRGSGVVLADAGLIEGDPAWKTLMSDKALLFYIYGTYFTPGPAVTLTRQYVEGVRIELRAGSDASAQLDTAALPLNAPEVLAGLWETDFSTDPTLCDANGDGVPDWTGTAATETPLLLSGGVWTADRTLRTEPADSFTQVTAVEALLQDSTAGGQGAGLKIPVDCSGGACGVVYAHILQQTNGKQKLSVELGTSPSTTCRILAVMSLSAGFQRVRFIIDPANDSVNCYLNGKDLGTFQYPRYTGETDRGVQLCPRGGDDGAQFDAVRVRVGGTTS